MEKYIIDKDEFQLYYLMLISEELLIIKEGVQKFSDSFARGRFILNSDKKKFFIILEQLLNNSKYTSIHKWIYKCTCFYSNSTIEEICKKNFFTTSDSETRNWIISTIASRYYNFEDFNNVINEMRHKAFTDEQCKSLDPYNIFYTASIFGHFDIRFNIQNISTMIFRNNDKNGMYWMSKLFAYSDLSLKKDLYDLVKYEELDLLTYSDDKQVQTYAYWGLVHRTGGFLKLVQEESKKNKKSNDSQKWYYAGIIPGEYMNNNFDFIEQILKDVNEKFRNNIRVKEGIIIGLNAIPYESCLDGLIIEWYYREKFEKIKIKILEYMIKNVNENSKKEQKLNGYGSFFSVIQDECLNGEVSNFVISYINVYKTLIYKINAEKIIVIPNEEEKKMSDNTISGGSFYGPVIMEYAGDAIFNNKTDINLFVEYLDKFIETCDDQELVTECKDVKRCIKEGHNSLNRKLYSFCNHLANFITIASAAPKTMQIAKTLIEYIQNVI